MEKNNHIFKYRKSGVTMFSTKLYSKAENGAISTYRDFIPSDEEIKSMSKDGYKAYLDGKVFNPGKTPRPDI